MESYHLNSLGNRTFFWSLILGLWFLISCGRSGRWAKRRVSEHVHCFLIAFAGHIVFDLGKFYAGIFFIVLKNTYHKFDYLTGTFLSVKFSSVKFIYSIVKQISRTFSSYKMGTLYPLNNSPPFLLACCPLVTAILLCVFINVATIVTPLSEII